MTNENVKDLELSMNDKTENQVPLKEKESGADNIVDTTSVDIKRSKKGKKENKKSGAGRAIKNLLKLAKPWWWMIAISVLLAVGAVALQLVAPSFVQRMVDYIIGTESTPGGIPFFLRVYCDCCDTLIVSEWIYNPNFYVDVLSMAIILAILYGTSFLVGYIQNLIMASVTARLQKRLRRRMSKKINKLPLSHLDSVPMGDTLSRITNDVDTVTQTINFSAISMISSATMIVGAMIFMFIENWAMALVAIVSTVIAFVIMGIIMKKSQKYFVRQQKELGDVNAHIEEYFTGHLVMKTNNARNSTGKKFDELNTKLFKNNWKSQFYGGMLIPLMLFLSNFSMLAVSVMGGILAFNGTITFGVIVSFLIYVNLFTQPLTELAQSASGMQGVVAATDRIFELLDAKEMCDESSLDNGTGREVKGAVEFNNVKFGYEKDKTIIHDFSADIKAGSKVAIVGPTGAGKTTLVNLLMKFYEIDGGEIKIDGRPISEIKRGRVANKFSMVLQDAWLFNGSVKQNLIYNLKLPKDKEQETIEKATKACGIDHFIKTLPNGYETILDDKTNISDGQKQLLTIARAMIKDAPLLILDEATSSVDTRTEIIVKNAMDSLMKGRTSFVIAHRLSTIKDADIILVLKDGDIIEKGTHDGLLKQKGFYSELYNSQFAA